MHGNLIYLMLLVYLPIFAVSAYGHRQDCKHEEITSKGFFSSLIRYLDNAIDFVYKLMFGIDSKPLDEEDDIERVSYRGFQLLRIWPRSDDAVEEVKALGEQSQVQLWIPPVKNMSTDLIIPPSLVLSTKDGLRERGIEYSVLSTDIEKIILKQRSNSYSNRKNANEKMSRTAKLSLDTYHQFEDINAYLDYLQFTYPSLVDAITIGKSAQGREIKVIRISSGKMNDGSTKPAVWIDGGIHSREWISTAVALYLIRQLVEHYKTYKTLVDDLDWYILPVANPDGYVYTHTTDRLWSKSRSADDKFQNRYFWDDPECRGVDLNRNWDFRWNEDGSGDNPCLESYAGAAPFSEPETRAMSNFILEHKDRIIIYLTLHAYNQVWLMPSSTKSKSNDYDDLLYMGRKAIESLRKTHGTNYELTSKLGNQYITYGSSDDWAKAKAGIKYSYTIELRDKGTYGFLLPPSQILPTSKEIFTAIRTLTKSVLNNTLNKNSKY